ncbi:hypothetical protein H6G54_29360 [Anabaena cylindrica FACHB-243]|uniref:Uncharacterized protein n=1 Tax=Anabaena cylindrica (strain ATCC 27899 / PCC 7122) TaxID=272123 RepID=K9ZR08_ANACC|nr:MULTISPECIES: hypothetical protein [Anabaena]AFZ60997.1 hypothetical protein Anacy_5692 [Anabaena cylindrica PCC 7122]MBD2421713.1 hypothetical protein [Anabaena cylindrica FACHB-243]MBY5281454.1 hypothetical protein [Anabaena sp. CCAP 1446/1C]MBY5309514.1 hypothetical protein [Anabaena sp. CCAP 1446/1C]MCM2409014.1 hypothetical protein [Anabaena sp. CCAP 1446/1C]
MSQQESNYISFTSNQELATPMDLFLKEEWLRKSIQVEEEVSGNLGAGLDWGSSFDKLLLNSELFYRLKTLRISLNREVRLLLKDWNLGTATSTASATVREKLLKRFRLPPPNVKEHIQAVLQRDELFGEEFISNHQVLRELLGVMLTQEDWEMIASVAADVLKQQIINQVLIHKISA